MKTISVLGIDLAKSVFQLYGRDESGSVVVEKSVTRAKLAPFVRGLLPCTIAMEAGAGAHHWAREFQAMGHTVRLIAPQFVKPFVMGAKNDRNDARGIVEAALRPGMRFVMGKTVAQQEIQLLHRIRQRLVAHRTALSNEIRGMLAEFGIVFPASRRKLVEGLRSYLSGSEATMSNRRRSALDQLATELKRLDEDVQLYDRELDRVREEVPACGLFESVPGVGPVASTALVAGVTFAEFTSGRHVAAWLGLTPRQHSSGGKTRLFAISKRGNTYLRTLLIHGARSVIRHVRDKEDRTSRWLRALVERRGVNRATVALAAKNARVLWAISQTATPYRAAA